MNVTLSMNIFEKFILKMHTNPLNFNLQTVNKKLNAHSYHKSKVNWMNVENN